MKIVNEKEPLYYFYLGSQTTPPCEEYVYHLVVRTPIKIANCQLKAFRENSMALMKERQIHSRLTQNNEDADENTNDEDSFQSKNKDKNGGKSGSIYVISKLNYDPDMDYDYDDELRKKLGKKLKPRKGQLLDDDDDDKLNC
jgi:hypothetical protein